jgi:hypothetical protein
MVEIVDFARLREIGREIKARLAKLDHLGGKTVDMFDSITCLLKEAEGLCDAVGFAEFKKTYCPELGQSRTYELLSIEQGRKTAEEIREANRLRVAKHRAKKKADVTEKDSVTLNGEAVDLNKLGPAAQAQIATFKTVTVRTTEPDPETRIVKVTVLGDPAPNAAAWRSHPRNASMGLKCFLNACYHFLPDLGPAELAKAEEIFKQCAKEAGKRAAKRAAA